jgi:hypothetical protein
MDDQPDAKGKPALGPRWNAIPPRPRWMVRDAYRTALLDRLTKEVLATADPILKDAIPPLREPDDLPF